ncbi:MAG TPA: hypothetical protein VHL11_22660 [Phototrophicaceae bacterium]|nr:hypothetical protein [Phototrophicaceae bacterium]
MMASDGSSGFRKWGLVPVLIAGFLFYSGALFIAFSVFSQVSLQWVLAVAIPSLTLFLWYSPLRRIARAWQNRELVDTTAGNALLSETTAYFSALMLGGGGLFGLMVCLLLIPRALEDQHPEIVLLAVAVIAIIGASFAVVYYRRKEQLTMMAEQTSKMVKSKSTRKEKRKHGDEG